MNDVEKTVLLCVVFTDNISKREMLKWLVRNNKITSSTTMTTLPADRHWTEGTNWRWRNWGLAVRRHNQGAADRDGLEDWRSDGGLAVRRHNQGAADRDGLGDWRSDGGFWHSWSKGKGLEGLWDLGMLNVQRVEEGIMCVLCSPSKK